MVTVDATPRAPPQVVTPPWLRELSVNFKLVISKHQTWLWIGFFILLGALSGPSKKRPESATSRKTSPSLTTLSTYWINVPPYSEPIKVQVHCPADYYDLKKLIKQELAPRLDRTSLPEISLIDPTKGRLNSHASLCSVERYRNSAHHRAQAEQRGRCGGMRHLFGSCKQHIKDGEQSKYPLGADVLDIIVYIDDTESRRTLQQLTDMPIPLSIPVCFKEECLGGQDGGLDPYIILGRWQANHSLDKTSSQRLKKCLCGSDSIFSWSKPELQ
ncbi:hypothetical protein BZG36_02401 [Bifiguratus adelaidae]|uniref:Uncharacterized protein n=1 Tax=Bifiguratus adelaidae TaxID=1938954 RepID=A0A261Y1B4_9FUNG|nr:hypothetical protein BZG36_02401 [Bifiguratus adelaidae]